MKELNEPNYEKALNNIARALDAQATQDRVRNLLSIIDSLALSGDHALRTEAKMQIRSLLGLVS